jgi:uncharacterized protein YndB with AHSA1/START domain
MALPPSRQPAPLRSPTWNPLEPWELADIDRAPGRFEFTRVIPASAAEVFALITNGDRIKEWFPGAGRLFWITPPPHGLHSVREAAAPGTHMREKMICWEPGRRLAFRLDSVQGPRLLLALAEDLQLEEIDAHRTFVRWRIGYKPGWLLKLIHPLARLALGWMWRSALKGIDRTLTPAR